VAKAWFESVAVAQRRAKRRLPKSVYGALVAGTERGTTLGDNVDAFGELGFAPRVGDAPADRDLGATVMGQYQSMPVLISPTGVQAVHPDGEVAVARAAAARGVTMGLSSFASRSIEDVVATGANTFFQIYWAGSRDRIAGRMERAKAAGAAGLILTIDWTFTHSRDWGSPAIPQSLSFREMVSHVPETVVKPAWLFEWLRVGKLPGLGAPNWNLPGEPVVEFFDAYGEWMGTPPPSWDDVAWMAEQWNGPFMVKGVMRVDDAKRAVDAGVTAISVSNHGGNNLDGTPAPIRALPAVVAAVGDQVEVVMDGGIRRGGDAVKAVALGARAVMIGRAYLWGLAANGQAGVENVLDVMRMGIDSTMLGLGRASLDELAPGDVLVPDGFLMSLGAD
jgi:heme/flavin dehydrogenase (mycofactocin system)